MHLRVADIDSRCILANREERFASLDLVEFTKAISESFEDYDLVEIWHASKVYQALLALTSLFQPKTG